MNDKWRENISSIKVCERIHQTTIELWSSDLKGEIIWSRLEDKAFRVHNGGQRLLGLQRKTQIALRISAGHHSIQRHALIETYLNCEPWRHGTTAMAKQHFFERMSFKIRNSNDNSHNKYDEFRTNFNDGCQSVPRKQLELLDDRTKKGSSKIGNNIIVAIRNDLGRQEQ